MSLNASCRTDGYVEKNGNVIIVGIFFAQGRYNLRIKNIKKQLFRNFLSTMNLAIILHIGQFCPLWFIIDRATEHRFRCSVVLLSDKLFIAQIF